MSSFARKNPHFAEQGSSAEKYPHKSFLNLAFIIFQNVCFKFFF